MHCPLFGADYFERGPSIVITSNLGTSSVAVTKTIDEEDLLPLDEDGAVHTDLPDDRDLPDHFELTYYALEVGFQRVPVYARTRVANNPKWHRIACCLVITPQEAQTYVTTAMTRLHQSAVRHRIRLGPKHLDIEPGDVLSFTHRGFSYLVKVHAATLAADGVDLELLNILTDESVTAASGFGGDPPEVVVPRFITAAHWTNVSVVGLPSVTVLIVLVPAHWTNVSVVGAPAVTAEAPGEIAPAHWTNTSTVGQPAVTDAGLASVVLREDGGEMLREDGGNIVREG